MQTRRTGCVSAVSASTGLQRLPGHVAHLRTQTPSSVVRVAQRRETKLCVGGIGRHVRLQPFFNRRWHHAQLAALFAAPVRPCLFGRAGEHSPSILKLLELAGRFALAGRQRLKHRNHRGGPRSETCGRESGRWGGGSSPMQLGRRGELGMVCLIASEGACEGT
eukprot:scaffold48651_cov57-Phaeocystis_antarctica.AAC.3